MRVVCITGLGNEIRILTDRRGRLATGHLRPRDVQAALAGVEMVADGLREVSSFLGEFLNSDRVTHKHGPGRLPGEYLAQSP